MLLPRDHCVILIDATPLVGHTASSCRLLVARRIIAGLQLQVFLVCQMDCGLPSTPHSTAISSCSNCESLSPCASVHPEQNVFAESLFFTINLETICAYQIAMEYCTRRGNPGDASFLVTTWPFGVNIGWRLSYRSKAPP